MQVIIAEKPSVAREIAAIVGAKNRKEGFIEGNGYAVTWAFGHLVGLAMPEQYGIEGFKAENLPILPPKFILLPRQIREGKEYKTDPGVVKQLGIIKELFAIADRIVVATDAGREGELIFRYIYTYLDCRKPFVRLWISSLTDKAIREGLQHLRPGEEYDTSTSRPKPAARPIGSSASTHRRPSPSPPDAACGRWDVFRLLRWRSSVLVIWKTRLSSLRPTFSSNSTQRRMRRFSPRCLPGGSTTKRLHRRPMPPSWTLTGCASSRSSTRR